MKTRIRQRDWLELAGEKIHHKQVGSVPTFLSVRSNKFAKRKTGFSRVSLSLVNSSPHEGEFYCVLCLISNLFDTHGMDLGKIHPVLKNRHTIVRLK